VDKGQVEPYALRMAVAEGASGGVSRVRGFEGDGSGEGVKEFEYDAGGLPPVDVAGELIQ
jgi:hypothetical protein